jgi:CHAT domain-containing protein/tetratricopeptide (TPR) repeat protein
VSKLRIAMLAPARRAALDAATRDYKSAVDLVEHGQLDAAVPLLRNSLDVHRQVLGDWSEKTSECYNDLAYVLKALGRLTEAEPLSRRSGAIDRRVFGEDHPTTAIDINNLASLLQAQGRYAEADALYQTALEIRLLALEPDHTDIAQALNNLASNLDDQGRFGEAEPLYRRALAIFENALGAENPTVISVLGNLGTNLQDQRRFDEADVELRRVLHLCLRVHGPNHAQTATMFNNLANNLMDWGKPGAARPYFEKALAINRHVLGIEAPRTAQSVHNLAVCLNHEGLFSLAEPQHRLSLALRRKALGTQHPSTLSSLDGLAHNLHAQGRFAEAEQVWREAADIFALVRLRVSTAGLGRASFMRKWSPSGSLAALLARRGDAHDAWVRLEDGFGQGLLDDLSARQLRPLSEADSHHERVLIEKLERCDEQVSSRAEEGVRIRRDAVQAELARFEVDLDARYGPAAGTRYDLGRIQAGIPADAALVAWLDLAPFPRAANPSGEHWACIVRSSGEPVWIALQGNGPDGAWTAADKSLAERVRDECSHRPDDRAVPWREGARKLADIRLGPLVSYLGAAAGLPPVKTLIILPSPALSGLPVEALVEAWSAAPFAYRISYAPSGTMLAWLRERRPRPREPRGDTSQWRLLALGDPENTLAAPADSAPPMPAPHRGAATDVRPATEVPPLRELRATLASLEGARREVQAVARLFHEPLLLIGPEASERRLAELARSNRLREFDILHLAVHGQMDARLALQSRLLLASDLDPPGPGRSRDGRDSFDGNVTAEQILRTWSLDAELVTLSACTSGLGVESGGEGYLGFAQALLLAGSRSLVLSLWEVDDRATSLLMQRFYDNLLGKGVGQSGPGSKALALDQAKRWLRRLPAVEVDRELASSTRSEPRKSRVGKPRQALTGFDHPYYWAGFILVGDPN